ncbi:hypothetical protein PPERSA_04078 [Pseudocohnilembus persalinus]|uniref:Uncharacterized protein n=1 Tax=Pseudocohnilembus persalinus TaxID=266149 RepID=A0A0V0QKU1_PSEPJ|nr:hypothetical protein PPERSA_04078 [Pseudocohnilembus persalinus]|eukprot:KRX02875.1 hypothetical protein PPERSA_04078 [Pseudocohnilembus persalinus]
MSEKEQNYTQETLIVKEKDYEFYNKQRKINQQQTNFNPLLLNLQTIQNKKKRGGLSKKIQKNTAGFSPTKKKPLNKGAQKLLQNAKIQFKTQNSSVKNNPLLSTTTNKSNPLASKTMKSTNPLDPLSKKTKTKDPLQKKSYNPLAGGPKQVKKKQPLFDEDDAEETEKKQGKNLNQSQISTNDITNQDLSQSNLQDLENQEKKIYQNMINENSQDDILKQKNINTGYDGHYWQDIRNDFVKIFGINSNSTKLGQLVVNPFGSNAVKQEDKDLMKKAKNQKLRQDFGEVHKPSGGRELQKITFKNYLINLEERFENMQNKWNFGDKVASLQLSIQQIKLLIENENPRFAPIKYVYIIDILEQFGRNVLNRMKRLTFPQKTYSELEKTNFFEIMSSNIPEQTKEVARNWIKKIGSIRELLPRMYIETTLLPLYYFFDPKAIKPIAARLVRMSRAIGDYINCMYFSTFFMRVMYEIDPKQKWHILELLKDFYFYSKQGPKFFGKPGMGGEEYFELFKPFLDTAFRYYCNNCSDTEFYQLFQAFQESNQRQEVLTKILTIFPTQYIAQYAGPIFAIIQNYHVDIKAQKYGIFLPKISQTVTNKTALQQICQLVWLDLVQVQDLNLFLDILSSLLELVQKAFTGFQKTKFFSDVLDRFNELFQQQKQKTIDDVQSNTVRKNMLEKLESFLIDIFESSEDVNEVISIDPLQQFVSYFPEDIRTRVCTKILQIYIKKLQSGQKITEPITVHSLLTTAKHVNTGLHITDQTKKNLTNIMITLIKRINFGKDLEQMLNLYTDIRGNFGNISEVAEILIYSVVDLTFLGRKLSKNKINKKMKAFLQACIAFCYISIPMVKDIYSQVQFYNLCTQVALVHNLISQADSMFKTSLTLLAELPESIDGKNIDEKLAPLMKNMVGLMIILPDDPEMDYLHFFQGFYKLYQVFKWSKKNGNNFKLKLLNDFVKYLCIQIQDKLPYHVEGVISNDQLFAEPEFKLKIIEFLQECIKQINEIQNEILDKKALANDIYSNLGAIKINLEIINNLIQYLKQNNNIRSIFINALNIIVERGSQLAHDRIGKVHFKNYSAYINSTIKNLEREGVEIENIDSIKANIERSQKIARNNL